MSATHRPVPHPFLLTSYLIGHHASHQQFGRQSLYCNQVRSSHLRENQAQWISQAGCGGSGSAPKSSGCGGTGGGPSADEKAQTLHKLKVVSAIRLIITVTSLVHGVSGGMQSQIEGGPQLDFLTGEDEDSEEKPNLNKIASSLIDRVVDKTEEVYSHLGEIKDNIEKGIDSVAFSLQEGISALVDSQITKLSEEVKNQGFSSASEKTSGVVTEKGDSNDEVSNILPPHPRVSGQNIVIPKPENRQARSNIQSQEKVPESTEQPEKIVFVAETRVPEEFRGYATHAQFDPEGERNWGQEEWLPLSPEDMPEFKGEYTPDVYLDVVNHFNVDGEENWRYKATSKYTYCNIFVGDVTRAMDVPLPRWLDGEKTQADTLYDWLLDENLGNALGWEVVRPEEAQEWANKGYPVVAAAQNPNGPGHISVVIPGEGEVVDGIFYPNSAQAGRENFVGKSTYEGFHHLTKNPTYFVNTGGGYEFKAPDENITENDSNNTASEDQLAASLPAENELGKLSETGDDWAVVHFSENYRELSDTNKIVEYVIPQEIILHWDGNQNSAENWTTDKTYNGLAGLREDLDTGMMRTSDSHFAVGIDGTLQMLDMREELVRRSYGAYDYPNVINIEMAGSDFKVLENMSNVPEAELNNALDLVVKLMIQYELTFDKVVGHYERDIVVEDGVEKDRGKPDPGPEFMEFFRMKLAERLNSLGLTMGQPQELASLNTSK